MSMKCCKASLSLLTAELLLANIKVCVLITPALSVDKKNLKNILCVRDCFLLGCFGRCGLTSEDDVLGISNLSLKVEDKTLSSCDTTPTEDNSELRFLRSIVAYGVGRFSTCPIASFQFALLLLLADMLQVSVPVFYTISTLTN